jgi:hypothetical protein
MNEHDENLNENLINQRNENQNEQNGEMYLNNADEEDIVVDQPLFDKISSRDLLEIINDTIPSIFFILFLFLPFYFYPKYCDLNMYLSMKTLIGIYSFFIGRALIKLGIIHFNKKNILGYKIFLLILDSLTSLSYYICIYFSYVIYSQSQETCFKLDTLAVFCFFSIFFIGVISFFQTAINFIMLSIYFFLMIETFISDPIYFYNHYGMDPEIIRNLSTTKADNKHVGSCVICLKDINEGDPIIILKCPGNHFFHGECIKNWLLVKTTCPICRSEFSL